MDGTDEPLVYTIRNCQVIPQRQRITEHYTPEERYALIERIDNQASGGASKIEGYGLENLPREMGIFSIEPSGAFDVLAMLSC